ncbi:hypothetical protein GCM10027517_37590 [Phycicoccus ginsengisoli]
MVHLVPAASGAGAYLDWGVVHVSVSNALIILVMLVVFAAALLLPFPGSHTGSSAGGAGTSAAAPGSPGTDEAGHER